VATVNEECFMGFHIYELGALVPVAVLFTDPVAGGPVNPSTVHLSVRSPSGVVTEYVFGLGRAITNPSVGVFELNIDADEPGRWWYYRWWSTGAGKAAVEERFEVRVAHAL
jgi:hypothetical protein